ncbi:hypothetical protein C121_50 [Stenotrophomonas phage C121]|uniref:hypothetical protein n=1 Tax=Stenotrophomonas phage C121 TaxID=2914029 RepID=UPI00232902AB|nr:hypothetical protein PP752_gp50 [Stenotrophomonas phage C121]UKL14783.1 hypothetical protein C121_50 [Stenotrophomonas phage C121]
MDKLLRSKLELALTTPDAVEVWNRIVKTHGLSYKLSYLTKIPTLSVKRGDSPWKVWMEVDTRKLHISKYKHPDPDAQLGLKNLEEGLGDLFMRVGLQYDKIKGKREISLRFIPLDGSAMTVVLDRVKRGHEREYGEFKLNDKW